MDQSGKGTGDKDLSPAERRRQRVRSKIIDAAEEVFATEGSAGLSIRRLAASVDYSPAAIYKYFESKEVLVDHLRNSFLEHMNDKLISACCVEDDIIDRTEAGLVAYIMTALEFPHHYESVWECPGQSSDGASTLDSMHEAFQEEDWTSFPKSYRGRGFGALLALVKEGQKSGVFVDTTAPEQNAKVLWAGAHGIVMMYLQGPNSDKNTNQGMSEADARVIPNYAKTIVRGICSTLN